MRNIREIQAELVTLRDQYEKQVATLEREITAVRKARGVKPKVRKVDPYAVQWTDAGRDATQWTPYERG